jgi:hypothetical protein
MIHLKHFETYICNILVSSTNQGQPPLKRLNFEGFGAQNLQKWRRSRGEEELGRLGTAFIASGLSEAVNIRQPPWLIVY